MNAAPLTVERRHRPLVLLPKPRPEAPTLVDVESRGAAWRTIGLEDEDRDVVAADEGGGLDDEPTRVCRDGLVARTDLEPPTVKRGRRVARPTEATLPLLDPPQLALPQLAPPQLAPRSSMARADAVVAPQRPGTSGALTFVGLVLAATVAVAGLAESPLAERAELAPYAQAVRGATRTALRATQHAVLAAAKRVTDELR